MFGGLVLAAFAYVMWRGSGNTFFYDEWTWIVTRSSGLHSIVASYNNHLLIMPLALDQLLLRTVGLDHYWFFRLLHTGVHLGCVAAVYVYARSRIGPSALLLTLPILVLGFGWEYVLWAVNIGFVAAIALSICALLALDRGSARSAQVACGLLVVALACSEFTVAFTLGIAAELLFRGHRLKRAYVWLLPLILYAVWWLAYHEPSMAAQNLSAAPAYAADLAAAAAGGLFGLDLQWGRVLLTVGAVLALRRLAAPGALTPRVVGLIITAGGFWLFVALGRAQLGDPTAPRYIYTGVVLIALIIAETWRGAQLDLPAMTAAAIAALFALAGNLHALTKGETGLRAGSQVVRAELGALELARPFAPPALLIDPRYMPGIAAGPYFAAISALGSSAADTPQHILGEGNRGRVGADGLLLRAGALAVDRGTRASSARDALTPPTVENSTVGSVSRRGSCVRMTRAGAGAALDVLLPAAGLKLSAGAGPAVPLRARRFGVGFQSPPFEALSSGATLVVSPRPDRAALPWHLRLSSHQAVSACALAQ